MTNIDTQIIYDKNGNPIPQYLDVSDKTGGSAGTMKPITGQNGAQNTQLTGSYIEHAGRRDGGFARIYGATAARSTSSFIPLNVEGKRYKALIINNEHGTGDVSDINIELFNTLEESVRADSIHTIYVGGVPAGAVGVFTSDEYPELKHLPSKGFAVRCFYGTEGEYFRVIITAN